MFGETFRRFCTLPCKRFIDFYFYLLPTADKNVNAVFAVGEENDSTSFIVVTFLCFILATAFILVTMPLVLLAKYDASGLSS